MACLTFDKRRKRWRVFWQVYRNGVKIYHGSKTFIEKSQAIKCYAKMEDIETGCRSGAVVSPMSFQSAKEDFFRHIKRLSPRTQQSYHKTLNDFTGSLKVFMIEQIEPQNIQDFLHQLRDKGLTARTINNALIAIKSFTHFCADRFRIVNPASQVKLLKEEPPDSRFLTNEEYQKVLTSSTQLATDRFRFLANTGLRSSEFASLNSDCIRESTLTIVGKGRKRRHLPLNQICLEILRKYPDLSKFRVSRSVLYKQCRRTAKKAGIPIFGPHSLRHCFATQLLLKGVPIEIVAKLLGHSSSRTTQTYSHILQGDIAGTTDCLL